MHKLLVSDVPASRPGAAGGGMHAALTAQAEASLARIRDQVAWLPDDDVERAGLEAQAAALTCLLDDLARRVPSPMVLAAAARFRTQKAA